MERGDLPLNELAADTDPGPAHPGAGAPGTAADGRAPPVGTAPEVAAPGQAAPVEPATTVFICTTCRAPGADAAGTQDGAALAEAAAAACPDGVAVKGVRCLANCKRALSAAIVRPDGWTYVFGDLTREAAGDLIAGARLLAAAPDGVMPWRGRPDSLKRGMVARIPPLTLTEEM